MASIVAACGDGMIESGPSRKQAPQCVSSSGYGVGQPVKHIAARLADELNFAKAWTTQALRTHAGASLTGHICAARQNAIVFAIPLR